MVTGREAVLRWALVTLFAVPALALGEDEAQQATDSTAQAAAGESLPAGQEIKRVSHRVPIWRGDQLMTLPSSDSALVRFQEPPLPSTEDVGVPMPQPPRVGNQQLDLSTMPAQAPPEMYSSGESSGGCSDCGTCGQFDCCCPSFWAHRNGFYFDFLYLHASGVDMAHAIQQNGTGGPGTVPAGEVGVVDPDYEPGFRVGFERMIDSCSSVALTYTQYYSHDQEIIQAPPGVGGTVASLVLHPQSVNAASTSSLVGAAYDIDFELLDVEYSRLLSGGNNHAVNYITGVRYGRLEQNFAQLGVFAPPAGTILTTTDIDFNGAGLRLGLDGRRRLNRPGFSLYGKGFINVLFGEFSSSYNQLNVTTSTVQAASEWEDERVLPVLEYEMGVTWSSRNGRVRWSNGYYTAFWFNTITTPEYVQAVQNTNFVDLGDTIAFDGFTSRLEFRY